MLGKGEEEGGGSAEPVSGPALPALNISLCGPGRERPEAVGESHASGSVESCFLGIGYPSNRNGSNSHRYSPTIVGHVTTIERICWGMFDEDPYAVDAQASRTVATNINAAH